MSLTFKLTIPDGELCEHLKGRDSKSRNFELIRLATNDLVKMNNTEILSSQKPQVKKSSPYIPQSNVIENDTKDKVSIDEVTIENTENQTSLSPEGAMVDFSDDIFDMG